MSIPDLIGLICFFTALGIGLYVGYQIRSERADKDIRDLERSLEIAEDKAQNAWAYLATRERRHEQVVEELNEQLAQGACMCPMCGVVFYLAGSNSTQLDPQEVDRV